MCLTVFSTYVHCFSLFFIDRDEIEVHVPLGKKFNCEEEKDLPHGESASTQEVRAALVGADEAAGSSSDAGKSFAGLSSDGGMFY